MKRNRFSEEQIIKILQVHASGVSAADLACEHGFAEGTIYTWKANYAQAPAGAPCERPVPGLPGNICLVLSSEYPLNLKGLRQSRGDSVRVTEV